MRSLRECRCKALQDRVHIAGLDGYLASGPQSLAGMLVTLEADGHHPGLFDYIVSPLRYSQRIAGDTLHPDSHIFILYGNGTDYLSASCPNPRYHPSPAITDYSANMADVTAVFNGLANGSSALLQMTDEDLLFPGSPRLLKGALVSVDPINPLASIILFQHNPDTMTHRLEARAMGGEGGDKTEVYRLTGPPKETITLTVEIDVTG